MRVQIERTVDAAFQRIVQDEIKAMQVLDHVTLDFALNELREFAFNPVGRQRPLLGIEAAITHTLSQVNKISQAPVPGSLHREVSHGE